jgi:hypothetical protein
VLGTPTSSYPIVDPLIWEICSGRFEKVSNDHLVMFRDQILAKVSGGERCFRRAVGGVVFLLSMEAIR